MLAGSLLTALGILGLLFHKGVSYNSRHKFPEDGPSQVITHEEKYIQIPPLASGAILAGGIAIMIFAARR